jgi:hypothetical protein
MKFSKARAVVICVAASWVAPLSLAADGGAVSGELRKWHPVTVTFDGPAAGESGNPNPFTDYRLDVTFSAGDRTVVVPGYYAADGNAAETGASEGNKWRVHFTPDREGTWSYVASFRTGPDVAVSGDPNAGSSCAFDGARGAFQVSATDKKPPDFRAKGLLQYVGGHYLRFAETGEYFIKGGADSPENFLGYYEFDQTPPKHRYAPHAGDWCEGDPTWAGGKGKNIIGALNYLASQGMNSVYFLTMNVKGDGRDVWPWTGPTEHTRFDCSKLDQWEVVFAHMDRRGLMLHVVTQEQENDQLLDGGELGPTRKPYYRELVARFAHHLAVVWNLGEENSNTTQQIKAFADYIRRLDPYDHPIVIHTWGSERGKIRALTPLLGYENLDGVSLQNGMDTVASQMLRWRQASAKAGHPWVMCYDEIGPSRMGIKLDSTDPNHDLPRHLALWGFLMAGGAGVEWFFTSPQGDLDCEDWRSRQNMWDQTRYALEFFQRHLPFNEMVAADGLTPDPSDCVLAKPGEVYAIYLPKGGSASLNLAGSSGNFLVRWFDPRNGGQLQDGAVTSVRGGGNADLGAPPRDPDKDWVVLVKAAGE